jgi:hypothetical protein
MVRILVHNRTVYTWQYSVVKLKTFPANVEVMTLELHSRGTIYTLIPYHNWYATQSHFNITIG